MPCSSQHITSEGKLYWPICWLLILKLPGQVGVCHVFIFIYFRNINSVCSSLTTLEWRGVFWQYAVIVSMNMPTVLDYVKNATCIITIKVIAELWLVMIYFHHHFYFYSLAFTSRGRFAFVPLSQILNLLYILWLYTWNYILFNML